MRTENSSSVVLHIRLRGWNPQLAILGPHGSDAAATAFECSATCYQSTFSERVSRRAFRLQSFHQGSGRLFRVLASDGISDSNRLPLGPDRIRLLSCPLSGLPPSSIDDPQRCASTRGGAGSISCNRYREHKLMGAPCRALRALPLIGRPLHPHSPRIASPRLAPFG